MEEQQPNVNVNSETANVEIIEIPANADKNTYIYDTARQLYFRLVPFKDGSGRQKKMWRKPDWFNKRELCGAQSRREVELGIPPCKNLATECRLHCGAWSASKGLPCPARCMKGMGRCVKHGGKTFVGAASSAWSDAGWRKVVPDSLADKISESANNPHLLSLQLDIAFQEARQKQAFERMKTGEGSGDKWKKLSTLFADILDQYQALAEANQGYDETTVNRIINDLGPYLAAARDIIEGGVEVDKAWKELTAASKDKAALIQVQTEREDAESQTVKLRDAVAWMQMIINLVHAHFTDTQGLRAFALGIKTLMDSPFAAITNGKRLRKR